MRVFITVLACLLLNNFFAQNVTLLSPNGGEVLDGCTEYVVSWDESNTSGFFNLDYSSDGGATWTSLASLITNTSFTWQIPNIYTESAIVKIYDSFDDSIEDQSDFVFTIMAPVQIIYPNGGEVIYSSDEYGLRD